MDQVRDLAREYQSGMLDSWEAMKSRVQSFFTGAQIDAVEAVAPGWRAMACDAGGVTLTHVLSVLAMLMLCPEYRDATPDEQALMEWIVLFHDVGKQTE